MVNTSLPEGNSSEHPSGNRYPRPPMIRALRWLLINWWLFSLILILVFYLLDFLFIALFNNQPLQDQSWWTVPLGLSMVGIIVILRLNKLALNDFRKEQQELRRISRNEVDFPEGLQLRRNLRGTITNTTFVWSPDGRFLALGSYINTIRLLDADTGAELHTLRRPGVCDREISLLDREERLIITPSSLVYDMDRAADQQRDREAAQSQLAGKIATDDFDVFLCHNNEDKPAVRAIGKQLKERGILPWLDEWELRPGMPWQFLLEKQIKQIKSVAVFVGKNGRGPWQNMELYAFLRQFVRRECPVIPVILAEGEQNPDIPTFLEGMTWVDFRVQDPDPMERLIWGITGKRSLIG